MEKIVNPCKCKLYDMHSKIIEVPAFVKIEYKEKKPGQKVLSITGVVGPMRNGDCLGSCGQCIDEISGGIPADSWDVDMIKKLCKIWERWHLNDMNAACEHQRAAGWIEKAKIVVKMYEHTTTTDAGKKKRAAENAALEALRNGETFTPTAEQVKYANLENFIKSHLSEINENYKIYKTEEKALGWLSPEEHPEGILGKECPVCGHKYGSGRLYEEVPEDVINWLFNLPDTKIKPAWV